MQSEKGFSLLEVVVSLALISIVLLSFYPFLINSKKMSDSNMERLVVINLADATLERLKVDQNAYIQMPSEIPSPTYLYTPSNPNGVKTYNSSNCVNQNDCGVYSITMNSRDYSIDIKATQNSVEASSKLIAILVTVKNQNKNISYSVEGYVGYE